MMRLCRLLLILAVASWLGAMNSLRADEVNTTGGGDNSPPASSKVVPADPVPADKETSALAFADAHHPELKSLVESLKSANPEGYRKAINDLHRTQERIIRLTDKNPVRAAHELELWKVDSRIRLTAARSAMGDPQEQREDLRALVMQRQSLKLKWMKDERKQVADRLAKLESELQSAQTGDADSVDAEVDRLLKSVKTKQPRVVAAQRESKKKSKAEPSKGKAAPGPMTPASNPAVVDPASTPEPTPTPTPTPISKPEGDAEPAPPSTREPLSVGPQS